MRVLALDTALGACAVGVFEAGRMIADRSELMARGHQERLGGMAQAVLAEAGGGATLDRIGVTVGPGSFTGLRVGLAFAQGLGLALDRPVAGISTLAALAASADAAGLVVAVVDARREQLYVQVHRDGAALGGPEALSADEAVALIRRGLRDGEPLTLVGSGAGLLRDHFPDAGVDARPAPDLAAIARLTAVTDLGLAAAPLYLRSPDATPPRTLP